ncbi:hypothetical protein AZE42_13059 [Rhizopogon vesiculosus]|uniref:Uncharacterized protein n=1 Tax=Rhizopogon vesiculosus TaxID=180088 RepID=A0A1J8R1H6_9AGAM|nr:hypothetical protein AZE42_13059 [Rhizopogon vesiculosus]
MWRRPIEPSPPTHLSTWDSSSTLAKTIVPPTPASSDPQSPNTTGTTDPTDATERPSQPHTFHLQR